MTAEHFPQLSALVDGELRGLPAAPLLDAVCRDALLRGTWERYHLIGQALRGERLGPPVRGLADAVRERLESEPPAAAVPPPPRAGRPRRPWRTSFAGAALAASLAFLAVFAVPGFYHGTSPGQSPDPVARQVADPVSGQARSQALADAAPLVRPAPRRWETDRPDLAGRLDLFLMTHQEATPPGGVKGMLPYATLVGYASGR